MKSLFHWFKYTKKDSKLTEIKDYSNMKKFETIK